MRFNMRPLLPNDLARAVHARAVREGRSDQSMVEQIVRAGLYSITNGTPLPPWSPAPSTEEEH
jgi:plasmid stability protein